MTYRLIFLLVTVVFTPTVLVAQETPLFDDQEPLTITIQAPLNTIFRDRAQESAEHPGVLSFTDRTGDSVSLRVDIKTRGKTRLDPSICEFPPLRLDLSTSEVAETLFAGQDKLKLVTHCQDGRTEYEQYVLQEYLIYRIYNLLADLSFRVRLAHITYVDTDGRRNAVTSYAFFIEDEATMAARNGWETIGTHGIPPDAVDPEQLALLELFQFMIGNTDWSAFVKEPEKSTCCHNTKPIGHPAGPVFSVPYDFDMAGLILTRYANRLFRGNLDRMNLRSVRERRYKGRCKSELYLDGSFRLFNEKREAIYDLYQDLDGLEREIVEDSLDYLEGFYGIINDARRVNREIVRRCRDI